MSYTSWVNSGKVAVGSDEVGLDEAGLDEAGVGVGPGVGVVLQHVADH